jgi:hypothetical protein
MDRNELPLDLRHLGVPSGVPKMISEPMVRSFQTVHLCCAEINTISNTDQYELLFDPRHLGVPFGVSKTIFGAYGTLVPNRAPMLCHD